MSELIASMKAHDEAEEYVILIPATLEHWMEQVEQLLADRKALVEKLRGISAMCMEHPEGEGDRDGLDNIITNIYQAVEDMIRKLEND